MKKIFTFLLVLTMVSLIVQSQTFVWKSPQPVSDSISMNKNPVIAMIDYIDGIGYYGFWERSTDTVSTDIFVKNMYTNDDPQAFIDEGDFHYENPQLINNPFSYPVDSIFYLVYESDIHGNKDIFVVLASASSISDPVVVTTDINDDTHMRCNNAGSIVWCNDGKIMHASIIDMFSPTWNVSEPIVISDSNSYDPVINLAGGWYPGEYIAWEQPGDTNIAIYFSYRANSDSLWSTPIVFQDTGYNTNMRFNNDFWDMGMSLMVWDAEENDTNRIRGYDFFEGYTFATAFYQSTPFKPTILPILILVDEFYTDAFFAFQWEQGGQTDILVSDGPWISSNINEYANISAGAANESNPQLFQGNEYSYYKDIILIWESERNNNLQLWSSIYSMPMGGVEENSQDYFQMKAYPNPFTAVTTIEYELYSISNIQYTVYNVLGEVVHHAEYSMMPPGNHKITWSPGTLPAGMYHAVLRSAEGVSIVKLVKQ